MLNLFVHIIGKLGDVEAALKMKQKPNWHETYTLVSLKATVVLKEPLMLIRGSQKLCKDYS